MSAAADRFRAIVEVSLRDEPPMIPAGRVAEIVGVSRRAINGWIRSGDLPAIKVSATQAGRVRVPREALAEFLARRAAR